MDDATKEYRVELVTDQEAGSPLEAAHRAASMARRLAFSVTGPDGTNYVVDLEFGTTHQREGGNDE